MRHYIDNNSEDDAETEDLEVARTQPRWLLAGVTALVLGATAYGLLHARGVQQARVAQVAGLLTAGREQENSSDYTRALDSFQKAERLAAADSGWWPFFTGLLRQQKEEAQTAVEQLAETWVWQQVVRRMERGIMGVDDTPIKALSAAAQAATGARKADLLAYIGYGTFLKGCLATGDGSDQLPATYYRQALAADPQNPYAHAFWAHLILCGGGGIEEAQPHFDAALAASRDRARVRDVELYALANSRNVAIISNYLWLKLVNQMHKAGEPLGPSTMQILASDYSSGSVSRKERKELYAAVPPTDHVELAHYLLESEATGASMLAVKVMLAYSLEADGKKGAALGAWQDVRHSAQQLHDLHYVAATRQALHRLGGAGKHHVRKKKSHARGKKVHQIHQMV